jgi:signal transduction histidine kinase
MRADSWLAAALFACSTVLVMTGGEFTASLRSPWWFVIAVLQCGSVALRRRAALGALAIAWVGALLQIAVVQEVGPQNLAVLVVLYSAAASGLRAVQVAGLLSAVVGGVLAGWFIADVVPRAEGRAPGSMPFLVGLCMAILLLAWAAGLVRSESRRASEQRVAAEVAAEQARHAIAVEEERARIARDMHDVVAHSLTVMIAQAEGARLVAETRGGASPASLSTIADTGRSALTDVRSMLADLRHGERDSPQPSLDRLDALIAQVRGSGATVDIRTTGTVVPLPVQIDMAVFRIIQEALTNGIRHGDAAAVVEVRVDWSERALGLTIRNRIAAGRTPGPSGHGLIGMRERAQYVGGTLTTAVDEEGMFVLAATLPLGAKAPQ